jgi:hypothetical protein
MKLYEVLKYNNNKSGGGVNKIGEMRNVNKKLGSVGHAVKKVCGSGSRVLYKMN